MTAARRRALPLITYALVLCSPALVVGGPVYTWSSGDAEQEAGYVTELYKEHVIHKWNLNMNDSNYVSGSGTGLALYGDVSGSGSITGTSIFGNVDIGNSPGEIALEDVTMSPSSTTTFEVAGIDPSEFDRLILVGSVALNGTAKITFDNFTPDQLDTFQLIAGWGLKSLSVSHKFESVAKHKRLYPVLALQNSVPSYVEIVPVYLRAIRKEGCVEFNIAECTLPRRGSEFGDLDELKCGTVSRFSLHGY
jgi:hypothetical protein